MRRIVHFHWEMSLFLVQYSESTADIVPHVVEALNAGDGCRMFEHAALPESYKPITRLSEYCQLSHCFWFLLVPFRARGLADHFLSLPISDIDTHNENASLHILSSFR